MMKKQAQRFEVISPKSQRSPGTSIYVISSRTGIRMDPYNAIFLSGLQLQKELFYTFVSDKVSPLAYFFHPAHSPWTTSSASHKLNYHPPLPFTNLCFQSCQTPMLYTKCSVAHLISPTAVQVSQHSHAEKSNSYFPHILL